MIHQKGAFWNFAKKHRLNEKDYTDLIGIVLEWMHMHGIEKVSIERAEKLYHEHLK